MKKILLVEDDLTTATKVSEQIKRHGYEVLVASSGEECLRTVATENIDLILLDYMLPGLSGLEVLKTIRESYSKMELPVIMITGKEGSDTIIEAFDAGANDFINKPMIMRVALARIKTLIEISKLRDVELQNKQFETLKAIITTYNHEINNPITIALSRISRALRKEPNPHLEKTKEDLFKISEIVSRIKLLTDPDVKISFKRYTEFDQLIDIPKNEEDESAS